MCVFKEASELYDQFILHRNLFRKSLNDGLLVVFCSIQVVVRIIFWSTASGQWPGWQPASGLHCSEQKIIHTTTSIEPMAVGRRRGGKGRVGEGEREGEEWDKERG